MKLHLITGVSRMLQTKKGEYFVYFILYIVGTAAGYVLLKDKFQEWFSPENDLFTAPIFALILLGWVGAFYLFRSSKN
jgi:hypothetical protein